MELNWIAAAMASTIIYAGVTIGDKLILTRLGIRLPAFYVFTGAIRPSSPSSYLRSIRLAACRYPPPWRHMAAAHFGERDSR